PRLLVRITLSTLSKIALRIRSRVEASVIPFSHELSPSNGGLIDRRQSSKAVFVSPVLRERSKRCVHVPPPLSPAVQGARVILKEGDRWKRLSEYPSEFIGQIKFPALGALVRPLIPATFD